MRPSPRRRLGLILLKYFSDAFEERHAAFFEDPDADPGAHGHQPVERAS